MYDLRMSHGKPSGNENCEKLVNSDCQEERANLYYTAASHLAAFG